VGLGSLRHVLLLRGRSPKDERVASDTPRSDGRHVDEERASRGSHELTCDCSAGERVAGTVASPQRRG
jgi:hypothetical protein